MGKLGEEIQQRFERKGIPFVDVGVEEFKDAIFVMDNKGKRFGKRSNLFGEGGEGSCEVEFDPFLIGSMEEGFGGFFVVYVSAHTADGIDLAVVESATRRIPFGVIGTGPYRLAIFWEKDWYYIPQQRHCQQRVIFHKDKLFGI